jgi:hypothetical protein
MNPRVEEAFVVSRCFMTGAGASVRSEIVTDGSNLWVTVDFGERGSARFWSRDLRLLKRIFRWETGFPVDDDGDFLAAIGRRFNNIGQLVFWLRERRVQLLERVDDPALIPLIAGTPMHRALTGRPLIEYVARRSAGQKRPAWLVLLPSTGERAHPGKSKQSERP